MTRFTTVAAIAALSVGAGACTMAPQQLRPENNPSLYSLQQPVVQRTDYVFDVSTAPEGVPQSELARLDAWFESIGIRYGDRIAIDEPYGYDNPAARTDVAQLAAEYGLLLTDGAPVTNGAVPAGSLRVVASRATANVDGCPVWADPEITSSVNTSTNFGCATNSNIAAMVANPNDLVLGQTGSVDRSARTASRAIRTYREGQPTGQQGLPATNTTEN